MTGVQLLGIVASLLAVICIVLAIALLISTAPQRRRITFAEQNPTADAKPSTVDPTRAPARATVESPSAAAVYPAAAALGSDLIPPKPSGMHVALQPAIRR